MQKFNNILVALDNTDLDTELITASRMMARLSKASTVKFIHIIRDLNIPRAVQKEFPHLIEDALNDREAHIWRKIERYFSFDGLESEIKLEIKIGQATKHIIKYSAHEATDLLIVGRKNEVPSGGVIVNRLARRAACSLLIVPKGGYKKTISKVLVATDFSASSLEALNRVIDLFKDQLPKPQIIIQHVYQVPNGYHYSGKTFQAFGDIMKKNAQKEYKNLIKKVNKTNLEIKPIFTLACDENVIDNIYRTAQEVDAGAIIIGAKGITATAALFIGSSAEKLVQTDHSIPVMVVRQKGKYKGLIDYLKEM